MRFTEITIRLTNGQPFTFSVPTTPDMSRADVFRKAATMFDPIVERHVKTLHASKALSSAEAANA